MVDVRIALTFPFPLTVKLDHDPKLDQILTLLKESTKKIMSQLSDALSAINDATNADAASAAAAAAATEVNATAVQALRDKLEQLIASGGTPTQADLASIDAIQRSLGATKTSLDATAERLLVIAADPQNPVPTSLPRVVPL